MLFRSPVNDLRTIKRISWDMESKADGWKNALTYGGSANYTGLGDQTGSGVDVLQAKRSVLSVVTGAREGRDAPELSWTNPNPSKYVTGWVLLRSANPEGKGATDADRGTWQQVGATFPVGVTKFTDTTLPAGYTATYAVRPNLSDGTRGPESNAVVTGLRPAQITGVKAAGAPTSIKVTWDRQVGATGYDLYRDNVKVTSVDDVTTWTDTLTYGRSHNYTVVGANRWESLISAGGQDKRATDGHQASQSFPPTGTLRIFSAAAGAFTAPAAPTATITPNVDWSYTIAWTPAKWTGAGPTSLASHRDRGWKTDVNASGTTAASGAWSGLWSGAENPRTTTSRAQTYTQAQVAGQYRHFRLSTCNEIGCSPVTAANGLQRAATPTSCTVAPADVGTRNVNVTINPAATVIANTGYWLSGGTGAPTSQGDQSGTVIRVDQLRHSTAHTFTVRSKNASPANGGYSDNQTCAGSTAKLAAGAPTWNSTTRKVNASFTPTNGTSRYMLLNGGSRLDGTSVAWDLLTHNSAFTVRAVATDGYNTVTADSAARTQLLATPVVSFGTVTTRSVQVFVSCANGTSCTSGPTTAGGSGSGAVIDRLTHGTTHDFYGRNSDGHNTVLTLGYKATNTLTVSTPTCTATRDGQYAPTTVRFSSNGSLNRTSVAASSAAYYSATATSTNSDGFNTVSRTNTCGITVEAKPWISGGASGTPSATCEPFRNTASTLLNIAMNGAAPAGYTLGAPVSGSSAADYGAYRTGATGTGNLQCTFYRKHHLIDRDGYVSGEWTIAVIWSQGTGGAS